MLPSRSGGRFDANRLAALLRTIAAMLARRGDGWGASLSRQLLDSDARAKLAGEQ